jgi:hypothetical protein
MNKQIIRVLNRLKRDYNNRHPLNSTFGVSYENALFQHQAASDLIKEKLLAEGPAMICRFGSVELTCVLNYYFVQQRKTFFTKSINYINGKSTPFWWDDETLSSMCNNAGFFPASIELLEKFSKLMLDDMNQVDILGSWLKEENLLHHYLTNAIKVRLPDLEPYYHSEPWTVALKGKTVLVIHPYDESIRSQYTQREKLFPNTNILPEFNLKTIKAVQSIANNKTNFKTWFEAYEFMCKQISETEFDIAIIGCGAYGFPLAAHVKRIGKKAVHLGGSTQILFGIKGKRWEDHEFISKLMNKHWVRPSQNEVPANYNKVEDGCYW